MNYHDRNVLPYDGHGRFGTPHRNNSITSMLQSGHEVTPRRAALGGAQALAEGILIHFVALLRHAKNDTFIIIHFLLDGLSSKKNERCMLRDQARI